MFKHSVFTLEKETIKFYSRVCLFIYLVVLFWVLFIGFGSTDRQTYFINPDDHFIPFHNSYKMIRRAKVWGYKKEYVYPALINILGNIALFVPWGLLSPLAIKKVNTLKRVALTAALISFSAEVTQYLFSIGIFDTDDIIYNTFGACIGFCFLFVVSGFFPPLQKFFDQAWQKNFKIYSQLFSGNKQNAAL